MYQDPSIDVKYTLNKDKILAYPNPFKKEIFINIASIPSSQKARIQIFNSIGSPILDKDLNSKYTKIDLVSEFIHQPAGIYIISIYLNETFYSSIKVIKEE